MADADWNDGFRGRRSKPREQLDHRLARVLLGASLVLATFLVFEGQRLLPRIPRPNMSGVVVWTTGLVLFALVDRKIAPDDGGPAVQAASSPRLRAIQWVFVGIAALGGVLTWMLAHGRSETADYRGVAAVWLASIAAVVLAAAWPAARGRLAWRRPGPPVAAAAAILGLALFLRLVELERFPSIINQDATTLANAAVAVRDGTLRNPFTTGWLDHPTLFAYFQAGALWLFGDTLTGVRTLSALIGAGAVLFTWLYTRRLYPEWVALLAAGFLAVFHFHLYFSRESLNNVADSFFLMAILYFLDRGIVEGRRLLCLIAGLLLGLSQYFYYGSRLLVPLTAVVMAYLLLTAVRGHLASRAHLAAWVAGGAVLVFLPLFAHYVDQPEDYNSRYRSTGVVGTGWLDEQRAYTGLGGVQIIGRQVEDALLLPFATTPHGQYRGSAPLLGFPMAVLTAVGIAVATMRVKERRYFAVAVAWWAAIASVGLTEEVWSHRFVIAAPLVAIASAIAVWRIERNVRAITGTGALALGVVLTAGVFAVAAWNIHYYFWDANEIAVYGGINDLVATKLSYQARDLGSGAVVYFAGPPRMEYDGFSSLAFVARQAHGVDLDEPLRSAADVPLAGPKTLFVFLPERRRELRLVRLRYPAGQIRDVRSRTGELLYTSLRTPG